MRTLNAPSLNAALPTGAAQRESFDPILACDGYLAAFESDRPSAGPPSFLHGWQMGRAARQRAHQRRSDRTVTAALGSTAPCPAT